jgi:hypothetical protein
MHRYSPRHAQKSPGQSPAKSRWSRTTVICAVAAGLTVPAFAASAARPDNAATTGSTLAAADSSTIVLGASGGSGIDELAGKVGTDLPRHSFGKLDKNVPQGKLINMKPNDGVTWRDVANARSGSAVYANLARWADTLKSRPGTIFFTFNHEPEGQSSQSSGFGTSEDFIAAFRKVRSVFEARGVTNVEYTWNMTGNSFRVPDSSPKAAAKWYPGDAYVDNVATAAYNWNGCGGNGNQDWRSLGQQATAPLAFAQAHSKKLILAEWASDADARRAQWLRDARTWLTSNKASIKAAFYYQSYDARGCHWALNTSTEYSVFSGMLNDRANFNG